MFDLTPYNTFNLTVFCKEGRTISTVEDLKRPINGPFIVLGGGSDVLFTEDFDGTVLINQLYGITLNTVYKSGKVVTSILKPESNATASLASDLTSSTVTCAQASLSAIDVKAAQSLMSAESTETAESAKTAHAATSQVTSTLATHAPQLANASLQSPIDNDAATVAANSAFGGNHISGAQAHVTSSQSSALPQIPASTQDAGVNSQAMSQSLGREKNLSSSQSLGLVQLSQGQDEDEIECYKVRVGGGEILDETIEVLLEHGISGMENLSLIPGTIGAAPIQNIGAYGVEIGDMIESVEAFDFASGKLIVMSKADCQFGYRSSYFKQHKERSLFITHVNLIFKPGFKPQQSYAGLQSLEFKDALAVRNRVIALRTLKLPNPRYVGNAGSFFKNPYVSAQFLEKLQQQYETVPAYAQDDGSYKLAAGWLIDKAGCRGIRHGQAGTWGNQALVIVNLGQAKPHEIVAMAKYVCAEVKSKFGLDLWPEVRLYGQHGEKEWDQI